MLIRVLAHVTVFPLSPELSKADTPLNIPASFLISKSKQWARGSFPSSHGSLSWLCSAALPQPAALYQLPYTRKFCV